MVTSVHQFKAVCNANTTQYTGSGESANCLRIVSSYFMGYALTIGSSIIVVLVLFSMLKRQRSDHWRQSAPAIPKTSQHRIGTLIH